MDRDGSIPSHLGMRCTKCPVPLGPRFFRPWFLSKVELEPVREMRALVDGFLLLAPCTSMGRLVQERLAGLPH